MALLLGHIHLYGKDDVSQSAEFYRLVLASEPPDTLRELAQQGLNEALERSPVIDVDVSAAAAEELASVPFANASGQPAGNDLIRDPFLNATTTRAAADNSEAETIETAMPWLKAESQQPKKRQQRRELDNAQEQAENPIALQEAPNQTSKQALSRPFDTDPERMESGLLRVTLKPNPQSGAPSAQPLVTPNAHRFPCRSDWRWLGIPYAAAERRRRVRPAGISGSGALVTTTVAATGSLTGAETGAGVASAGADPAAGAGVPITREGTTRAGGALRSRRTWPLPLSRPGPP